MSQEPATPSYKRSASIQISLETLAVGDPYRSKLRHNLQTVLEQPIEHAKAVVSRLHPLLDVDLHSFPRTATDLEIRSGRIDRVVDLNRRDRNFASFVRQTEERRAQTCDIYSQLRAEPRHS
jgi:hypothetical protein